MSTYNAFNPENPTPENDTDPWSEPKRSKYNDMILKPEYEVRRMRFTNGLTWFRIVPAKPESKCNWLLPVHVLKYKDGCVLHPKSLRPDDESAFDSAYSWMRDHHPEDLFSKENKDGARLLTDPMGVFWVIAEENGKRVARLVVASGYNGSRGGTAGLGHQIWRKVREKDETGKVTTDAVDAKAGLLVCVERTQARGAKYPNYTVRLGRQPCPIDAYLENVDPEEVAAICPLEHVVHDPSEEEQWNCIEKVISPELATRIRTDLQKAA